MNSSKSLDYETCKELFGLISETLGVGFMLIDYDYGIIEINNKLLMMLRKTIEQKKEYIGHNLKEFFRDEEEFSRWDQFLKSQPHAYQYEENLKVISGRDSPVLVSVRYLPDIPMEGKPDGISTVLITDIHEQKKTQSTLEIANRELVESKTVIDKKNKMLEAILFGIGDCVTIFDMDKKLLLSNPKGLDVRGDRKAPLLALKIGATEELTFTIDGESRYYTGRVEGIFDEHGLQFAYAEILKDISYEIELNSRNKELQQIKSELKYDDLRMKIIGVSSAMRSVFDVILRCAHVTSPVLILGESGVGKEMVAHAIHENSNRKDKPFVAINCGALPENLLESELFGHVKGAFTGAVSNRPGLFREAQGGTLFLDEVADLKQPLQAKLLRALQGGEIRPVGGDQTFHIDVRFISAANRDLNALVKQGLFRLDLYYRLSVIPVFIPPLRSRKEDILLLVDHFIKKQCKNHDIQIRKLNHDAQNFLLNYSWPGNIRELENAIEYALAMATGSELTTEDFPMQANVFAEPDNTQEPSGQSPAFDNRQTFYPSLKALEEEKIEKEKLRVYEALRIHGGNRALAANELGISKSTLWRKIKKCKLDQ